MGEAFILELLFRGAAIGALIATGVALGRRAASLSLRIAAALFFLSLIGYLVNTDEIRGAMGWLMPPLHLLAMAGSGLFWLFVITLFEDRRLTAPLLAPAGLLLAVGLYGVSAPPPIAPWVWVVHNLIEIVFAAHALYVIVQSWRGDLVEARRRLRAPFLGITTIYAVVLAVFEIGESFNIRAEWYPLLGAVVMCAFCTAGALLFLDARADIFGRAAPALETPRAEAAIDPGDRAALAKLDAAMGAGAAWRREGLTIGQLATEIGAPEHRLRRLINDHLGWRNFAAYVNAYRIAAAKAQLTDPEQARKTVSSIAFELGFGSLGPFNRAFKEATGLTPTQWRRGGGEP